MIVLCKHCEGKCVKNGRQRNGSVRYKCSVCKRKQQEEYVYNAYLKQINKQIKIFVKEGVGIRSTSRILNIAIGTVIKRILLIAKNINQPMVSLEMTYEVDEIRTYVKNKKNLLWIVYAFERESKRVVCFNVGSRTNKTLKSVLETLFKSQAKKIYTDKLKNYSYLILKKIHRTKLFGTNHIERFNLNMRTHIKRLNRRTICYSKDITVLFAILKIYFWG